MTYERQGTFDDLNNALFTQMERLMCSTGDSVKEEIERSKAVGTLADGIIGNYTNAINLLKLQASEHMVLDSKVAVPKMLGGGQ